MSIGLAISGLLYPTVGLALFVAWGFASKWEQRGHPHRAFLMRTAVVLVACWPLVWSLNRIYVDLGTDGLWKACGFACAAICLYLLAFRVRAYTQRRSIRGGGEGFLH